MAAKRPLRPLRPRRNRPPPWSPASASRLPRRTARSGWGPRSRALPHSGDSGLEAVHRAAYRLLVSAPLARRRRNTRLLLVVKRTSRFTTPEATSPERGSHPPFSVRPEYPPNEGGPGLLPALTTLECPVRRLAGSDHSDRTGRAGRTGARSRGIVGDSRRNLRRQSARVWSGLRVGHDLGRLLRSQLVSARVAGRAALGGVLVGGVGPGDVGPRDVGRGDVRPGDRLPGDVRPGDDVPGRVRPGDRVPRDRVPGDV